MKPKVLAFYLPQFHRVKENSEWWGEGFTDWVAVKGAEKLYEGHNQPRVPLNNNYYDLSEQDTMKWQSELMDKYHIDGMCIYHYWFEDGRRILEKPAENLIKWKDIQMPFCFCWANETWSKTWTKFVDTNVWMDNGRIKGAANGSEILLRQIYGREKNWEEHIQYLLQFFADSRYIKLDGKPVFAILKQSHIYQIWEMLLYFDKQVKENGYPGLYVIGMEEGYQEGINAVCIRQPRSAMAEYKRRNRYVPSALQIYPYDELCRIQMEAEVGKRKTYLCGVVDYDSTPRMGQNGMVMQGASPEKFYGCFKNIYEKSMLLENEFIFINAWNEWGESMYLEPDEKNGYGYLDSVRRVIEECCGEKKAKENNRNLICKITVEESDGQEEYVKSLKRHDWLLDNWMNIRDHDINVSSYFEKYGYNDIAIYGMGKLGMHLYKELMGKTVQVGYGIDMKASEDNHFNIYNPYQEMPKVDAVVITILGEYRKIGDLLRGMDCPIITLEEIIQELMFDCLG